MRECDSWPSVLLLFQLEYKEDLTLHLPTLKPITIPKVSPVKTNQGGKKMARFATKPTSGSTVGTSANIRTVSSV